MLECVAFDWLYAEFWEELTRAVMGDRGQGVACTRRCSVIQACFCLPYITLS